jgi:hypothetical protein
MSRAVFLAITAVIAPTTLAPAAGPERPNVLLIVADDLAGVTGAGEGNGLPIDGGEGEPGRGRRRGGRQGQGHPADGGCHGRRT